MIFNPGDIKVNITQLVDDAAKIKMINDLPIKHNAKHKTNTQQKPNKAKNIAAEYIKNRIAFVQEKGITVPKQFG